VEEKDRVRTGIRTENQINALVGRNIHAKQASIMHNRRLITRQLYVPKPRGNEFSYLVSAFGSENMEVFDVVELRDLLLLDIFETFPTFEKPPEDNFQGK
jgi:hypothetical protein